MPKIYCEFCNRIIGEEDQNCTSTDCPYRDKYQSEQENFIHCSQCGLEPDKCQCAYETLTT